MSRPVHLTVAALALAASACGSTALALAQRDLGEGRFPRAMVRLRAEEDHFFSGSTEFRCRYALLRGLSHLALGDGVRASDWLASAAPETCSGALTPSERRALRLAWASLGHLPR